MSSSTKGSKRPAAAMSSDNQSESTPKRSKSADTAILSDYDAKSNLAYYQGEEAEDAARIAHEVMDSPGLRSETPATVIGVLRLGGKPSARLFSRAYTAWYVYVKSRFEPWRDPCTEINDSRSRRSVSMVDRHNLTLAIEPFALHEHWVLNRRSTFDIVKDMLRGDAYISQVPYLTTEEILGRENLYQKHEAQVAVKRER
ncbi:hypothetical protein OCU04_010216 [Sclerotinia nivalis]|uniref:Uncharacterized protein n=1 Tax=Sclerotinia nivalis TaxID=352851 RepID=A0A9X0DG22_9HELO|nr:hypothetical protein OCU04_010216 [Sclerotinia nivalis]